MYFNDVGMLYTQGWVTISGTMKGDGEDYRIEPPSLDPSMLYVWSDVVGPAIEVRTANTDDQAATSFRVWTASPTMFLASNRKASCAGVRRLVPRWIPISTAARRTC